MRTSAASYDAVKRHWLKIGLVLATLLAVVSVYALIAQLERAEANRHEIRINAARPGAYVLSAQNTNRLFSALTVQVEGNIDGHASLEVYPLGSRHLTGKVKESFGGDWFDPTCAVKYTPTNVTNGHLILRFQFH